MNYQELCLTFLIEVNISKLVSYITYACKILKGPIQGAKDEKNFDIYKCLSKLPGLRGSILEKMFECDKTRKSDTDKKLKKDTLLDYTTHETGVSC